MWKGLSSPNSQSTAAAIKFYPGRHYFLSGFYPALVDISLIPASSLINYPKTCHDSKWRPTNQQKKRTNSFTECPWFDTCKLAMGLTQQQ